MDFELNYKVDIVRVVEKGHKRPRVKFSDFFVMVNSTPLLVYGAVLRYRLGSGGVEVPLPF